MLRALLEPTPTTVLVFAIGLALLGLGGLLQRSSRRVFPCRAAWLAVLGVALGATIAAAAGAEQHCWLPALVLTAIWATLALLRGSSRAESGSGFRGMLANARVHAGLLTLLGPTVLLAQVASIPREEQFDASNYAPLGEVRLSAAPVAWAMTDQGRPFPLYAASMEDDQLADVGAENKFLDKRDLLTSVIRTGDPDLKTNCHGWVFTAGKHWVRGVDVDRLLQENGYRMVSQPQVGDVALFRALDNEPMHTSLVRSVAEDGTIVMESKWGHMGRFLHTATRHPYAGHACTYYHSDRKGHVLQSGQ
jgi:hypothetical protein